MSTPADLITLGIGPGGDIPSILTGGLGVAVYIAPDGIVFLHLPARSTTLHLDTRTGIATYVTVDEPTGFTPVLPFDIEYLIGSGTFRPNTDFDLQTYAGITVSQTYYVSTSGLDTNTGLSWAQALRTVRAALSKSDYDRIYVEAGYYYWNQSYHTVTNPSRSFELIGVGNVYLTSDIYNMLGAWTLTDSHYSASLVATPVTVYDATGTADAFGDEYKYTAAASVAAVDSTPGSWYWSGGTIYIRTFDSRVPDASIRYYYGAYALNMARDSTTVYIKNIKTRNSYGYNISNLSATGGMKFYADAVESKYCHGASANGFTFNGLDKAILFNCTAAKVAQDGIQYNALNTINTFGIEYNCESYDNGVSTGTAFNGSTAHNACNTVRIMGAYHHNRGPNTHDIGGGMGWWLGVESYNAEPFGTPATQQRAGFTSGAQTGSFTAWADTCDSHDNYVDLAVDATGTMHKVECTGEATDYDGGGTLDTYLRTITATGASFLHLPTRSTTLDIAERS